MSACVDEPAELVRQTIGPAGGLISSSDQVLTLVIQPGSLTDDVQIEITPSEEPPFIFGPAYRVKPDIEVNVEVEVSYRRTLPNNLDGVAVASIRLDDYTEQMGHWVPLPRLAIDPLSDTVLAIDSSLSLYYGLLDSADITTTVGTTADGSSEHGPTDEPE